MFYSKIYMVISSENSCKRGVWMYVNDKRLSAIMVFVHINKLRFSYYACDNSVNGCKDLGLIFIPPL